MTSPADTKQLLFEPERHEALTTVTWSNAKAREGVIEIAEDALAAGRHTLWPLHPDDGAGDELYPNDAVCLYFGAAGVVLALDWLSAQVGTPLPEDAESLHQRIRDTRVTNVAFEPAPASWFFGGAGFEAVMAIVSHGRVDAALDEARHAMENPTHDPLTGAGNVLLGLLTLRQRYPDDQRIVDLFREGAARELAALQPGPVGCDMWLVDLYGNPRWMVGAGHGAAGNFEPLLLGANLLDESQREHVVRAARALLASTAVRDGHLANWRPVVGMDNANIRVQWCHGAPGMILSCAAAAIDDDETLELLVAGGELTWHAGPLSKGPTVCHGTAGSALALLQLFALTGDELWLDRARSLAMHALEQVRKRRTEVGHGRYSLMTGDLGVAACLVLCDQARPGVLGLNLL